MKNFNLLTPLFLLAVIFITSAESQSQTKIKGNGDVVKVTRSLSSFNSIEVNSVMNVYLKQSDIESVTIEADKNIIPYIITKVDGNTLEIQTKKDYKLEDYEKLNVYVSLKNLNNLENNSVGNVETENQLKLSSLTVENNSVGNLNMNISCDNLNVDINSVGNVTLRGKATKVNIENNSVGNLEAFDLTADILKIESNSVGNSEVSASGEIYIESNGVGTVYYKGNAVLKKSQSNGLGKVKKK